MQHDEEAIPVSGKVKCVGCGKIPEPEAEPWKAHWDDAVGFVLFCPECSEREFGEHSVRAK